MTENYYYKKTEPNLWTVGFGEGKNWEPESDHDTQEAAVARVRYLHGGNDNGEVERLREEVRELKALQLRIWQAFSAADSTLRLRYAEDLRGEYSKDEAERLTKYMTGER